MSIVVSAVYHSRPGRIVGPGTTMTPQLALEDSPDDKRLAEAWEHGLSRLKGEVPAMQFERYLRPLRAIGFVEDRARFAAPTKFVLDWVRTKHGNAIETILSDELGRPIRIEWTSESRQAAAEAASTAVTISPDGPPGVGAFVPNPKFTFDNYVVGDSNRLAHTGAMTVARDPGGSFNPLFIYGPSGLGKTHLLHAIASELRRTQPAMSIQYISSQQFAEEFITAIQSKNVESFRRQQRGVGVYLLDDIQLIAGRDKTLEEVFHTYNYLYSLGKQIVFTSDRPPRDLHLVDDRLRSRFEAGLVAGVGMPDTETRCAILLDKARRSAIPLTFDVAMHLAESVPSNIRTLEGALTKLVAEASVRNSPIDLDFARELTERYYSTATMAKPGSEQIIAAVGKHFSISPDEIRGSSRKAPIVHARHIAVYITRELTQDSWKHIGGLFGDRDHTSMMHGYQKISTQVQADRDLQATVQMLMRNVAPNL